MPRMRVKISAAVVIGVTVLTLPGASAEGKGPDGDSIAVDRRRTLRLGRSHRHEEGPNRPGAGQRRAPERTYEPSRNHRPRKTPVQSGGRGIRTPESLARFTAFKAVHMRSRHLGKGAKAGL